MHIDVWIASLVRTEDELARLTGVLSPDEIDRASRFWLPLHRDRFASARGILRSILSAYLDIAPHLIELRYGAYGKPALGDASDLRFNLSHSGDVLLAAVAHGVEVGVDVERIRTDIALEAIACRVMPAAHVAELEALDPEDRPEAFFTRWTCLEARLKARGLSIAFATDAPNATPAADIVCQSVRPRPGYVGAVAVDLASDWTLECREWSE